MQYTVEPRLSGPPLSEPLDYLARKFSKKKKKKVGNFFSKNGRVSSCYHGHKNVHLLRMRRRPHSLLFIN